jgi:hypothetical protein
VCRRTSKIAIAVKVLGKISRQVRTWDQYHDGVRTYITSLPLASRVGFSPNSKFPANSVATKNKLMFRLRLSVLCEYYRQAEHEGKCVAAYGSVVCSAGFCMELSCQRRVVGPPHGKANLSTRRRTVQLANPAATLVISCKRILR